MKQFYNPGAQNFQAQNFHLYLLPLQIFYNF
nr:MAG TPA: hypothetical protein [Caudoviricetes sp.]